jgi:putative ABC transport system substrate-binding protein
VYAPQRGQAQQVKKIYRIGFLWDNPGMFQDAMQAFKSRLRELGWIEGNNVVIEYRWTGGHFERLQPLADELVKLKVDVIIAPSSIYTAAAKRATKTIPIVFFSHADPVGSGHVANLARPEGNVTGFSLMMTETNVKLLELVKDMIPGVTHVAVIWDPATPSHHPGLKAVETAGHPLGIKVSPVAVRNKNELDDAFKQISHDRAGGVLVLSTPQFIAEGDHMAQLALKYKLPTLFGPRAHVESGGLLSYSPDRADLWRRGADYVDRILKGTKPADLPVQQPVRFDLALNRKTLKALGLKVPPDFMLRVDTFVE